MTDLRVWFGARPGRSIAVVLFVGLAIREAFSFWTGHPYDLEVWIRTGHAAAGGASPYAQAWPAVPGVSFGYTNQPLYSAAYLPFWPDIFGGSYLVWEHIGGGNRFVLYFLLKQGPIAGDLAVAGLLYRYVLRETGDVRAALSAMSFWAFFPYDIAITAIWGQLDSVTTVLILAVLLAEEARAGWRSMVWGVGTFVKWITVVFLPLEFFRNRGLQRLWPLVGLGVTGALTLVAFDVPHWPISILLPSTTSSSAGGGGGMNYAQLANLWFLAEPLNANSGVTWVLSRLWIPAVVAAGWYAARWFRIPDSGRTLRALLFVLTTLLLFRWGLYEQYMLYPFALLAADVYTLHPKRREFLYFLIVLATGFFLVNNVLGIWFATPAYPNAFVLVQNFDSSATWGTIRYDLLDVFAVLMTATLVQLLVVLVRDDPAPRPWIFWPWRLRPRAPDLATPPSPAASGES
ncbi:MAG: hypothetical protein L3K05_00900 [Thermoplasmata archaeon]|nr:hypothetical protein [Thermoplasmata archaeon]